MCDVEGDEQFSSWRLKKQRKSKLFYVYRDYFYGEMKRTARLGRKLQSNLPIEDKFFKFLWLFALNGWHRSGVSWFESQGYWESGSSAEILTTNKWQHVLLADMISFFIGLSGQRRRFDLWRPPFSENYKYDTIFLWNFRLSNL